MSLHDVIQGLAVVGLHSNYNISFNAKESLDQMVAIFQDLTKLVRLRSWSAAHKSCRICALLCIHYPLFVQCNDDKRLDRSPWMKLSRLSTANSLEYSPARTPQPSVDLAPNRPRKWGPELKLFGTTAESVPPLEVSHALVICITDL